MAGTRHGLTRFIIPAENLAQAILVPGVQLVPITKLQEFFDYLNGTGNVQVIDTATTQMPASLNPVQAEAEIELEDVVGQIIAKRAVTISAAGGHNLLLGGPPGTGKSMLARTLPGLLPPLDRQQMLEVTHLHSLAGNDFSYPTV